MSNARLQGNASGTGTVTLETPNTNSDRTISFPDADGEVMVSGNMPAFSAYKSGSNQTVSNSTATKVTFESEEFDTASCFASSRFTPTVAGYYQINAVVFTSQTLQADTTTWLYKNGSQYKRGFGLTGTTSKQQMTLNCLVYLNGSTDYVEIYVYSDGSGNALVDASQINTWFQGSMVRGA